MDTPGSGRRIKSPTITPALGMTGGQVTHVLDSIALFHGYPAAIRTAGPGIYLPRARSMGL